MNWNFLLKAEIGGEKLSWKLAKDVSSEYSRAKQSGHYDDSSFLLSSKDNYENDLNDKKQIFRAKDSQFIDEPGPDDIAQGEAGDCWFLSSLCAFANEVEFSEKDKGKNCLLYKNAIFHLYSSQIQIYAKFQ